MKQEYQKPVLYVESFTLANHIAGGCGYKTNFGNGCPIEEAGMTFFVNEESCSEDAVLLWIGAGVMDESQRTVENLSLLNIKCYNSFADFTQLFNS